MGNQLFNNIRLYFYNIECTNILFRKLPKELLLELLKFDISLSLFLKLLVRLDINVKENIIKILEKIIENDDPIRLEFYMNYGTKLTEDACKKLINQKKLAEWSLLKLTNFKGRITNFYNEELIEKLLNAGHIIDEGDFILNCIEGNGSMDIIDKYCKSELKDCYIFMSAIRSCNYKLYEKYKGREIEIFEKVTNIKDVSNEYKYIYVFATIKAIKDDFPLFINEVLKYTTIETFLEILCFNGIYHIVDQLIKMGYSLNHEILHSRAILGGHRYLKYEQCCLNYLIKFKCKDDIQTEVLEEMQKDGLNLKVPEIYSVSDKVSKYVSKFYPLTQEEFVHLIDEIKNSRNVTWFINI